MGSRRWPRAFAPKSSSLGFGSDPQVEENCFSGDNVYVPQLPQQALKRANADDLSRLTADQLRDVGDASVDIATVLGDTVVVLGLSLGGNIAAWVAQFHPEVARVVVAALALRLSHPRPRGARGGMGSGEQARASVVSVGRRTTSMDATRVTPKRRVTPIFRLARRAA